jgi:hypothetical protein
VTVERLEKEVRGVQQQAKLFQRTAEEMKAQQIEMLQRTQDQSFRMVRSTSMVTRSRQKAPQVYLV